MAMKEATACAPTAMRLHVCPDFSFIVPVRNDAKRLRACLRSIAATRYPRERVQVIVVDHQSTDDSAKVARTEGALTLHANTGGPASLRNLAASRATGAVLAFVDADHEIAESWPRAALESLSMPGVAAVGALSSPPENGTWVQRLYGALRGRSMGRHDVEWLGAGNLAVLSEAFARVGGFDTSLETCEDVDLCQRLRQAGYRLVSDSRMATVHHGDPATLAALFRGELWRGRDNLRVSLRGPLSWRGVPSLAIPVLEASMPFTTALGLTASPRFALGVLLANFVIFAGLASLRALMVLRRLRAWDPKTALRTLAVCATYDLARAAALVVRVGHRRERVRVESRMADA
jgi:GT2 family glycosyltransferase